ncbi:hypothetical protein [Paracidovorax avenae]|uniref:hypothetical protein n=1 Tax=Paracidovorax avenae TaxID=80867 RepID=UPI0012603D24|nr:hypothetical protein [Paracidovorax avenae]
MEDEYEDVFEEEQREREKEKRMEMEFGTKQNAILREAENLKSLGVYDTVEDAMDEARVNIEERGGF